MNSKDKITTSKYINNNPKIMGGIPVIVGTRIPIARILFLLKDGYTIDAIANDYPQVGKSTIEGAISEAIGNFEKPNAKAFL